ncbi:MAG: DUF2812 domain-containing protein [Eubacteriales bacterium]|nr:DUF2812 domain-containing protein [Eubacteriales bacterium]
MTAKKNLRKIWWFDEWQVEEIESWLGDMAARGWHFSRRGLLTAVFTRGEPEQVRYRCEIAKKSSPDFQDRVEFYRQGGWEYVASDGHLQIFRAPGDSAIPEIHTDPQEQAGTLRPLFWTCLRRLGAALLLLAAVFLPYSLLYGNYLTGLLLQGGLADYALIILMASILVWMGLGVLAVFQKAKDLRQGRHLEHKKKYSKVLVSKPAFLLAVVLVFLFIAANFVVQVSKQKFILPLPQGDLPVVRIADLAPEAPLYPTEAVEKLDTALNIYWTESSLLVPKQWNSTEYAGLLTEVVPFDTLLVTSCYEARNNWLAARLAAGLVDYAPGRDINGYDGSKLLKTESAFAALWKYHNGNFHEIIAQEGKYVYHVYYQGRVQADTLLELIKAKLESLEDQLPLGRDGS